MASPRTTLRLQVVQQLAPRPGCSPRLYVHASFAHIAGGRRATNGIVRRVYAELHHPGLKMNQARMAKGQSSWLLRSVGVGTLGDLGGL